MERVVKRLGERAGHNVSERWSRPRNNNCRSRPDFFTGKAADDGDERANKLHWTCRGNGDGMQAEETRRNTGNPPR